MKTQFLKIAGVNSEKEFYQKYPTEESFFAAHPEANMMKDGGNVPTNPELWSRAKAAAKQKYDVYPSAYANGFAAKWYKERGGGWRKAEMGGCMECGGQMAQGGPIAEYSVNPMEMFYQEGGQNDQMYQSGQEQPDLSAAIGEISKMIMQGDDPNEIYGMLVENGVEEDYALDILEEAMEGLEETDVEEEDVPMSAEEMQEFESQEEQVMQEQLMEEDDELYSIDPAEKMREGGPIRINPAKKGTFKAQATRMGMSVQEAAEYILRHKEKYSPAMVKKANFAKNFAKELGGEIFDLAQYKDGGGIPQRYRTMGFTRVGAKRKSTRPGKKWMVLAKKGDQYKVVHGGWKGMQDFSQHRNAKRKERFWDRMGGKDSAKAKDPFSPLYWHKRFGTWQQGGATSEMMNYPGYVAGDFRTDVTTQNSLANLTPNKLNKSLAVASTLADPRNMVWALPSRGFLGAVKGLAGAAAGISGAALGYQKLFSNNPAATQSYITNYTTNEQGKMEDVLAKRTAPATKQHGGTHDYAFAGVVDTPFLPQAQQGGSPITFKQWFVQNSARPDVMRNASNQQLLMEMWKRETGQATGALAAGVSSAQRTEEQPQFQSWTSSVMGDPTGQIVANNALAGLGMLNDVLSQRNYAREYEEMLRRTGNTDNRYNASNAVNPFGNYTLNAGPASNFGLVANTPIQDFGTTMAGARYGGTASFDEGGEYVVSDEELQAILAMGGEIEYLD